MEINLLDIENKITEFWTKFFKITLFFLPATYQSLVVSLLHYLIFIAGFVYFFFYSKSGDIFRIVFFILVLLSAASYFIFNKCFFTSIERSLSPEKNAIQSLIDNFFGEEVEGNITSKIVLVFSSILLGIILLRDNKLIHY